jgi:ABC transport system ATP-binding/permease protein
MPPFIHIADLTPEKFNPVVADSLTRYLDRLDKIFGRISNSASDRIDRFLNLHAKKLEELESNYYNHSLKEIVTKPYERRKILLYNNTLVQNTDPVYLEPYKKGMLEFRTHFFSPSKYVFGVRIDTFVFNITLVLFSTIILYITLYFELLGRAVRFFENFKLPKKNI